MPTAWCNFTFPSGLHNWGHHDFAQIDWEEANDGRRYDSHPGRKWKGDTTNWREKLPPVAAQWTRRPHNKKRTDELAKNLVHASAHKPAVLAQFCSRPVNWEHLRTMAEPKPVHEYQEPDMPPRHRYFPSKKYLKWLATSGETREPYTGKMHSSPSAQVRRFLCTQFGSVLRGWEALGAKPETKVYQEVFVKALTALGFPKETAVEACKDLVPKQRDYDYIILGDIDPQAARVAVQYQDASAPPFGTDPHSVPAPLKQLCDALLARFPSLRTAWEEFLDPDGHGGITKAQLLQCVRALGLSGSVKGIDGNAKGVVARLWASKDADDEFFYYDDLEAARSDVALDDGGTINDTLMDAMSLPSLPGTGDGSPKGKLKPATSLPALRKSP